MINTPNHTPSRVETVPASNEVRSLYSIDLVNEWRSDESLRLGWLRGDSIESGNWGDDYVSTFKDDIEAKLDEFLATRGVTPNDPEYDSLRQLYRDSSIDRFSENAWGNSPASRGVDPNDTRSQRDIVAEAIRQWHSGQENSTIEGGEEGDRTADIIRAELNEARESWSAMQAKRQGRLWDRRIPGYNAAKERYDNLQRELGSNILEDTINDSTLSDAEKNAAVIAYIFEEQNALRALTNDKVKNTKVGKFVEKFGGWLNKGSGWTKFGKAAAVGFGAGIVGAGAGLLFGAAGMGAVVAGAGVMVTKGALRFTKAYAKSDAQQGRGMNMMEDDIKTDWSSSLDSQQGDSVLDKAMSQSHRQFEADTKKEQNKRRKTTAMALGGVALGSGLGAGVGFALDYLGVSEIANSSIAGFGQPKPGPDPSQAHFGPFQEMQRENTAVDPSQAHFGPFQEIQRVDSGGNGLAPVANIDSYKYPWNWAADEFGKENAMTKLEELAKKASAAGHKIEWHNIGDSNELNDWLKIDGKSGTKDVVEILNRFK